MALPAIGFAQSPPPPSASPADTPAAAPASDTPAAPNPAHMMVVADAPEAAEAGREILRKGGSALDAAIAAEFVLNLVEPDASGIGGGGYLLYFNAENGEISAFDGREAAPAAATPDMLLNPDGKPMEFYDAATSGLAVGVPGLLRLFEAAHASHGKLPWEALFQPAIDLAEQGFIISPRLQHLLAEDKRLRQSPAAARYFYQRDGQPKPAGSKLTDPAFAQALRRIAKEGAGAFYEGEIGKAVVTAVQAEKRPGRLALSDLSEYQPRLHAALCQPYRNWLVCGAPPSSAGGIAVLEILGMIEHAELGKAAPLAPAAVHAVIDASRLAFADRELFLADSAFVPVPTTQLLSADYLNGRAALVSPKQALNHAEPGQPNGAEGWRYAVSHAYEQPAGTQISVIDGAGNSVSLTAGLGGNFGAHIMVQGFLLNSAVTDFSFRPESDGRPVVNRIEPKKRPLSSMAPMMVFDPQGKLVLVLGAAGGARAVDAVAETLVATLDWKLDIDKAIALPRFGGESGPAEIERGPAQDKLAPPLRKLGHDIAPFYSASGVNAILVKDDGLYGAADPRRSGEAAGD